MKITFKDLLAIGITYCLIQILHLYFDISSFICKNKWKLLVLFVWILVPLFLVWAYPQLTFLFVFRFWAGIIFALCSWYGFRFKFNKDTYLNFYLQKRKEKKWKKERYCKGCYQNVSRKMFCICGEFKLHECDTIDGIEYRKMGEFPKNHRIIIKNNHFVTN